MSTAPSPGSPQPRGAGLDPVGASVVPRAAVVPGSFDPVTNGHADIITRTAAGFDRVVVACLRNRGKTPLFELDERLEMLREVTAHLDHVEIASFTGLLVDFCTERGVDVVVKGLRAVSDFEYEMQMAQMNRHLSGVDTHFLVADPRHAYLSSSLVKEVARYGGDIGDLVPEVVAKRLGARFGRT